MEGRGRGALLVGGPRGRAKREDGGKDKTERAGEEGWGGYKKDKRKKRGKIFK